MLDKSPSWNLMCLPCKMQVMIYYEHLFSSEENSKYCKCSVNIYGRWTWSHNSDEEYNVKQKPAGRDGLGDLDDWYVEGHSCDVHLS